MQLKTSLPDWAGKLLQEEILYALPFDVDATGKPTDGYCVVTAERLAVLEEDRIVREWKTEAYSELETEQLVGSGMLTAKLSEGGKALVCVFSHRWLPHYAELASAAGYTRRTGNTVGEVSDNDAVELCPKCGMPLPPGSTRCPNCSKKGQSLIRLMQFAGPYKKLIIFAAVAAIACEMMYITLPYLQRIVIDDFITPKLQDWPRFWLLTGLSALVVLGLWLCDFLSGRLSVRAATGVSRDLRGAVFSKIQSLSMRSLSKRTAGELINRVTGDTRKLESFIVDYGKDALVSICSTIIVAVLMFIVNWRLSLLVILPIPFVFWMTTKLMKSIHRRYNRSWPKWDESNAILHDVLSGVNVIKTFGTEDRETKRYADSSLEFNNRIMQADVYWFKISPMSDFLITCGEFLALFAGAVMILNGEMQLGELVQFTTYVAYLYVPMRWFTRLPKMVADASIAAGKIFDVLDEESEMKAGAGKAVGDLRGEVEFRDVSFGYKVYSPVLKHVSFKVKPGEMIGIVGHSGAGKTTLINLLMRLYDPADGQILIDGADVRDMDPTAYRNRVGVVLQENFLFAGTIFQNIAFSKPGATMLEVVAAAKVGGAHDFIVKLPDGYNTRVGDKGYTLSGGERQRIAIARAVLHNPAFLILDEATASLDTETEKQIQEAIARVSHGRTTFAIAHRLSTLRNADRLLVIDKGELVESGTHLELMQKGGVYHDLVMAQRQTSKMKE